MDFGQAAELVEALRSKDETKAYQCFKSYWRRNHPIRIMYTPSLTFLQI